MAGCQKKAYAHQNWPPIIVNIEMHVATTSSVVGKKGG